MHFCNPGYFTESLAEHQGARLLCASHTATNYRWTATALLSVLRDTLRVSGRSGAENPLPGSPRQLIPNRLPPTALVKVKMTAHGNPKIVWWITNRVTHKLWCISYYLATPILIFSYINVFTTNMTTMGVFNQVTKKNHTHLLLNVHFSLTHFQINWKTLYPYFKHQFSEKTTPPPKKNWLTIYKLFLIHKPMRIILKCVCAFLNRLPTSFTHI